MDTPYWKVRAGAAFAHNGLAQKPGAVLQLARRVASEFTHALDECDPQGTLLVDQPGWRQALETVPTHENVDVLQAERVTLATRVAAAKQDAEEATTAAARAVEAYGLLHAALNGLDARIAEEVAAARQVLERRLSDEAAAVNAADGAGDSPSHKKARKGANATEG